MAVDGACEELTTTGCVLADECSEVFVMLLLFNLSPPLRDGAAVLLVVVIFIGPDPCPGDVPLFINDDAEAVVGVAERLVSCAMFIAPSSLGTHCIERPVCRGSKGTARHFWPRGQACNLYFPSLPHVAICSLMQTMACVFIFRSHVELGLITEKNRLNSDAITRVLIGITMLVIVGDDVVTLRVLRWITENGAWNWLCSEEGVAVVVDEVAVTLSE